MFRTHQSQILAQRFESIAGKIADMVEARPSASPAYALPAATPVKRESASERRRRIRRKTPLSGGVSVKSTWY